MKKKIKQKEEAKPMNAIIILIGRRLQAAVEREMRALDEEIRERNK